MKLKRHDWHFIVMILCFIYGGISLLFFLIQMSPFMNTNGGPGRGFDINTSGNFSGPPDVIAGNFSRRVLLEPEISRFFYLIIFVSLFGSFISIMAGLSLLNLIRKKERKELTKGLIDTMTTPEEKLVIKILNESGGELTQSELVRRTRLSKVKVHRVVKRLESLKVVNKYSYGLTNKIKLNDSVFESDRKSRGV